MNKVFHFDDSMELEDSWPKGREIEEQECKTGFEHAEPPTGKM